jgi:uncharacterized RmlC-like cupin family protein
MERPGSYRERPSVVVMSGIEVVRGNALTRGSSTRGITRDKAFEEGMVLVSRSRIASGVVSDWHHHGRRRLFGVLLAGRLRLEYGPHGKEAVDLEPGDFFRIPVGLVHRDVNPDAMREAIVAAFLEGEGIPTVNVAGPEGGV